VFVALRNRWCDTDDTKCGGGGGGLRGRFGSKRLNVREGWSEVHNEELRELYCTTNINRINKFTKDTMDDAGSANGKGNKCKEGLNVERLMKETTLEKRCRWEDNIKIDPN